MVQPWHIHLADRHGCVGRLTPLVRPVLDWFERSPYVERVSGQATNLNPPTAPHGRGGFVVAAAASDVGTQGRRRGQLSNVVRARFGMRDTEIAIVAALVVVIAIAAGAAWSRGRPVALALPDVVPSQETLSVQASVTFHVIGAVRHPGVYTLPAGARVMDAVRAAGGLGAHADQRAMNLARLVVDGEQIVIWRVGELDEPADRPSGSVSGSSSEPSAATPVGGRVNINLADAAELDGLPGIGPALAQRIVEYREANGAFRTPGDLVQVSGIGPKTFERLEPLITV